MRIGFNARLLLKGKMEGIGWHAYEIINRLIKLHPEHEFVLFYDRKNGLICPDSKNVKTVHLFPPSRHPILMWYWFEMSLKRAIKKYKIDIFYSPEVLMPGGLKIPCLITLHDISPIVLSDSIPASHARYYAKYIARNLKQANHVFTVSNFSKAEIITHYSINENIVTVIYNAAREIFKPISDFEKSILKNKYSADKPYFIYIGSIHKRKNVDHLINAFILFKSIYKTNHKLLLVGRFFNNKDKLLLNEMAEGLTKDILFYSGLEDPILAKLLAAADVLINLSAYEGFGMQIVEAFSAGVPVIASDLSCFPEIAGSAAKLVNPYNAASVAEAMHFSISNPEMIEYGLEKNKKYNWDHSAHLVWEKMVEL